MPGQKHRLNSHGGARTRGRTSTARQAPYQDNSIMHSSSIARLRHIFVLHIQADPAWWRLLVLEAPVGAVSSTERCTASQRSFDLSLDQRDISCSARTAPVKLESLRSVCPGEISCITAAGHKQHSAAAQPLIALLCCDLIAAVGRPEVDGPTAASACRAACIQLLQSPPHRS
jgi:hypothetical protein